ncbi:efflux RND transporter periplasmic adaptor subunit [candidate division KSB1 bacterium]|nr:efflux RND transporter periplasmic adaptor subunit [candidate division KSB1 bacterium]
MKKYIILIGLMVFIALFFNACSENKEISEEQEQVTTAQKTQKTDDRSVPVEALIIKKKVVEQNFPMTALFKPLHQVDVLAEVSGEIKKINKNLGDMVTAKDTLAFIDDLIPYNQYRQANAQVLSAENNLKITRLNLQSDKELFDNGDISNLAYENSVLAVKTAEANHLSALANLSLVEKSYRDTRIMSPFAGLISRKYVELGSTVNPGVPLYRIVDLGTMKLEVGIPQAIISHVRVGSRARVIVSALNNQQFEGEVRFISPQAEESSGAFITEIYVKNTADLKIRAGMTARGEIIFTDIIENLVVPEYALVTRNGDHSVYKVKNGIAKLVDVEIGETYGTNVIIQNGLAEGDTIVIVGMKNLGVETKVWIESLQ